MALMERIVAMRRVRNEPRERNTDCCWRMRKS